jgi:hypothetical protein
MGCILGCPRHADDFIRKYKNRSGFIESDMRLKDVLRWLKGLVTCESYSVLRIIEEYDDVNRSTYSVWYDDSVGAWVYFVMSREEFFKYFKDDRIDVVVGTETVERGVNRVHIEIKYKIKESN